MGQLRAVSVNLTPAASFLPGPEGWTCIYSTYLVLKMIVIDTYMDICT